MMHDYDDLPPHVQGDYTSLRAAVQIAPHTKSLRQRVFEHIEALGRGGATCDEVEVLMQGRHQTISARVYELHKQRRIVFSGAYRRTRSGALAKVYVTDSWLLVGEPGSDGL